MARPSRPVPRSSARDLAVRALLGLAGGVAVWAVIRWTPTNEGLKVVRGILALASLTLPVVLLGAYGALRPRTLALWTLAAAGVSVLGGIGRMGAPLNANVPPVPAAGALVLACLALIVGHVLVLAREGAGRGNPWPRHFAIAWTDGVRAALSVALVGALFGLVVLASNLFELIGVQAVGEFLTQPGVLWPLMGLAFGLGVHFTAGRPDLAAGARTLGLGLLAWLLPVMVFLAAAFLATLPFTGLKPLWDTGSAAALLITACIGLIILVNAAIQDETNSAKIPRILRYAARLSGLLMAPLVVIAAVGIFLRIGQYGLSPDRVRALACLLVLAVFAGGHLLAALSRRSWIDAFGKANLTGVLAALVAILFILSPVGDPDRLSVMGQMRRLASGQVALDRFDFDLLRFDTGALGRKALKELAVQTGSSPRDAEIRRAASEALASKTRRPVRSAPPVVIPVGTAPIPADFLASTATIDCDKEKPCGAMSLDITDDGKAEVLLQSRSGLEAWTPEATGWRKLGELDAPCPVDLKPFLAGDVRVAPPGDKVQDVMVGGVRLALDPQLAPCPPGGAGG
ncbi:MAG: DUF4153 domain-containing protein [Phenylobacterium sp.]|uniref:DUF4153 domain-containing protein n=1 Tax=Phenylobacterium sp. TaxID=1871053 RepID=UPI0030198BB3